MYFDQENLITFNSREGIEPPDPTLLEFHLAIAGFLHASGMGQELDQPFDEMEELGCFAGDGSTDMAAAVGRWLMMVH